MGFPTVYKTAFLLFVAVITLVDHTFAITNDSCVGNGDPPILPPFVDPNDNSVFYQCFWINDPACQCAYWYLYPSQCPPGGYFDEERGQCFKIPVAITNDSCIGNGDPPILPPFVDPNDFTIFHQCFWMGDPACSCNYWYLYSDQCPAGGYFDEAAGACFRIPATPPPPFHCGSSEGYFPDISDCRKYNRCLVIQGIMRQYGNTCPAGSYFDQVQKLCVAGTC